MTSLAPAQVDLPVETTDAQPISPGPKGRRGLVTTFVLAVIALFWISPLALLVLTAVRPLSDFIGNGPLSWPDQLTWSNFKDAWGIGNFATTYRNSLLLALMKVPLGVLISAMLGFALAKLRMKFRRTVMFSVFLGLTIPIYITIVLPLSVPALVTVAILDAVATWNEFLFALIVLNSDVNKTIPVGLLNFQGQFANNNTGLAAGILIAVVPILLAYVVLQRWIVGGLTAGATKG